MAKGTDTMKKIRFAATLITAAAAAFGMFSFSASANDGSPYFIKDGNIKGFINWEETLNYINRHGNDETDYTIYIDEDTTVLGSMKFPSSSKARSITFKGVGNNYSTSPDSYSNNNRDNVDEVHTITLRGIKTLQANCDIIFENIMIDSEMPFVFKVKNDITFDTNFEAKNMTQLKGGSGSTLWVKLPGILNTSNSSFVSEGVFNTNNFEGRTTAGKYYIDKYTGTSAEVKVPADANGADTVYVATDAFDDLKNTLETIAFQSGSAYTVEAGTCEAFPALKEVRIGYSLEIAGGAFKDCTALEKVVFTGSLTSSRTVKEGAFKNCTALKTLTVPSKNINIEANAFEGCPIEDLTIEGGMEKIFADTTGLALKTLTITGDTVDAENLAKLITDHTATLQAVNLTTDIIDAFKASAYWNQGWEDSGLIVCIDPPVVIPTLDCTYEVAGFNEIRPDPGICVDAKEKFKANYFIFDNDNILSVHDKSVAFKYIISANKTGVTLLYNDEFKPVTVTGEVLATNSIELERSINGVKGLFDWDSIVLTGKNLVPEDMFYVDPECLEDNGTIPYLLSKEKKDVYLRRLAFRLSGKNSDGTEIDPIYFSQWKDLVEYIEDETTDADILITVLSDTDIGQGLKMPKKGKYATLTMTGGDFERMKQGSEYLTYKGFVLPDLSVINLPEGKTLSMVDFSDAAYAADQGTLPVSQYKTERRAVTFTGNITLTGDTRFVDLILNSRGKAKNAYNQFNITAAKYTLMLDKVFSDGYIKNVKSSGDVYVAGGNTSVDPVRFIGTLQAKNLYIFNGYIRVDKAINGGASIRTFNSNLINIIAEKAEVDTTIDTATRVGIHTSGTVITKLFDSSFAENPESDTVYKTTRYVNLTLNPSKASTITTFSRTSLPVYLSFTDTFGNVLSPEDGLEFVKIKGDYLKDQLDFDSTDKFEVVRSAGALQVIKKDYGYYLLDNSTASENPLYNKYRYAYASLNDAIVDMNRMRMPAEYVLALPRYVRQISKLAKLKSDAYTGTVKLVVTQEVMDDAVQDKEYIIGVNQSVMKILDSGAFDWTSQIDVNPLTGNAVAPFDNPIRIYVE